jgi:hypothetical protein
MRQIDRESPAASWWRHATPTRRLAVVSVPLGALLAIVFGFHALDAREKGESPWGVVGGIVVAVVVLASALAFSLRPVPGATEADAMRARSRQMIRWAAPLAAILALATAVAQWLTAR